MQQMPHSQHGQYGQQHAQAEQAVTAKLIRLHDELRLSDGQEGAWHDYTMAIAPDPQAIARHRATTELLPLVPTPRRIALIEATMAQDAIDFRRESAAVSAFYARLTPQQQQIFDRETLPSGAQTPQPQ
ncbi:Spy/CpxP family protein refolding chaperone [Phenylobacterium sp.]|uniref:Spy/CpxP family protein refolding chaperone n=1 Tax=Phenylobacterium sp. TaxID=1871053 RepID=UPI002F3E4610